MQLLEIKAGIQIAKPPHEVFEAIVDPQKMSNYFIAQGSGRMEGGKDLVWRFPEFDMDVPVRINKIEPNAYISFYWDVEDQAMLVEINLQATENEATVVTVTEGKMENNEKGIAWLKGNTEGWANFLACLKAYLEFGINLRKGSFDYRKNEFEKIK